VEKNSSAMEGEVKKRIRNVREADVCQEGNKWVDFICIF
jgi:hypothetical protein